MNLERDRALEFYRQMVLVRRFEEKCAELYSAGKIRGFLHLYVGEEAVAVGTLSVLTADDNIVATYREHGHAIVRGTRLGGVMAEMYGKATGCSRGRGGSMHLFDVSRRFYGGHAIVGGGLPMAAGLALADKLRGRNAITASYFGDGAVDEGEFHETMNLAALWRLPVVFFCENNRYAMGTELSRHQSVTDLTVKPRAYGIDAESVEAKVRETKRPRFLELRTYRFRAHSMYDPELYRSREEVREWMTRHDPIDGFESWLRRQGFLTDAEKAEVERRVGAEIDAAVAEAEAAPFEPVERLTSDVYTEIAK